MIIQSLFTIILILLSPLASAEITTEDASADTAWRKVPSAKWVGDVCYLDDQVVPLVHAKDKCGEANKKFAAVLKAYKKQKLPDAYLQEAGIFNLGGSGRIGKVWCVKTGLSIKYPSPGDCRDYCSEGRCMPMSASGER